MFKYLRSVFSGKNKVTPEQKNGYWKEFNKQGILISEGEYNDGVRNGLWKLYYETGELVIEETYTNGQMDGAFRSFYKSGFLISEGCYTKNMREGKFTIYDQGGTPVKIMHFQQDILLEEIMLQKVFSSIE